MDYLYQYGLFLAQAATVVVAFLVVISSIAAFSMRRQQQATGHLEVRKLNEHFSDLKHAVPSKRRASKSRRPARPRLKLLRKRKKEKRRRKKPVAKPSESGCSCWISTVICRPTR